MNASRLKHLTCIVRVEEATEQVSNTLAGAPRLAVLDCLTIKEWSLIMVIGRVATVAFTIGVTAPRGLPLEQPIDCYT